MRNNFMNLEENPQLPASTDPAFPSAEISIESGYEQFVPEEFKADPFGYFETSGGKIKTNEAIYDAGGRIRENPGAVRRFPVWTSLDGPELRIVGKIVDPSKGKARKFGNPFYEYEVLKKLSRAGLPCAKPIAKITTAERHMFLMESVPGITFFDFKKIMPELKEKGWTDEDFLRLEDEAYRFMDEMREKFESAGIIKEHNTIRHGEHWKTQDMVFDIDFNNKKIRSVVPTDFEKTKVDEEKLVAYIERNAK